MDLTIYIVGVIVAFFTFKWCFNFLNEERTWAVIFISFILSFASWATVLAVLIATAIMHEPNPNSKSPKPPKWL